MNLSVRRKEEYRKGDKISLAPQVRELSRNK